MMTWLSDGLSLQERRVVLLAHAEGLSPAEIGQVMAIHESDVRRIHADVVQRVKDQLGVNPLASDA
jgi:DNA-directed RNA polymerase specialized sigma24 family protein